MDTSIIDPFVVESMVPYLSIQQIYNNLRNTIHDKEQVQSGFAEAIVLLYTNTLAIETREIWDQLLVASANFDNTDNLNQLAYLVDRFINARRGVGLMEYIADAIDSKVTDETTKNEYAELESNWMAYIASITTLPSSLTYYEEDHVWVPIPYKSTDQAIETDIVVPEYMFNCSINLQARIFSSAPSGFTKQAFEALPEVVKQKLVIRLLEGYIIKCHMALHKIVHSFPGSGRAYCEKYFCFKVAKVKADPDLHWFNAAPWLAPSGTINFPIMSQKEDDDLLHKFAVLWNHSVAVLGKMLQKDFSAYLVETHDIAVDALVGTGTGPRPGM